MERVFSQLSNIFNKNNENEQKTLKKSKTMCNIKTRKLQTEIKLNDKDVLYLDKDIDEPAVKLSYKSPKCIPLSLRPEEEDFHHEKYLFNEVSRNIDISKRFKT